MGSEVPGEQRELSGVFSPPDLRVGAGLHSTPQTHEADLLLLHLVLEAAGLPPQVHGLHRLLLGKQQGPGDRNVIFKSRFQNKFQFE